MDRRHFPLLYDLNLNIRSAAGSSLGHAFIPSYTMISPWQQVKKGFRRGVIYLFLYFFYLGTGLGDTTVYSVPQ